MSLESSARSIVDRVNARMAIAPIVQPPVVALIHSVNRALPPEMVEETYKKLMPGPRFVAIGPLLEISGGIEPPESALWDAVSCRSKLPKLMNLTSEIRKVFQKELKLSFHITLGGRPVYFNTKHDILLVRNTDWDVFKLLEIAQQDGNEEEKKLALEEKKYITDNVRRVAFAGELDMEDVFELIKGAFPNITHVILADTLADHAQSDDFIDEYDDFVEHWRRAFPDEEFPSKKIPKVTFVDAEIVHSAQGDVHVLHVWDRDDGGEFVESTPDVDDFLGLGEELKFGHKKGVIPNGTLPNGRHDVDQEFWDRFGSDYFTDDPEEDPRLFKTLEEAQAICPTRTFNYSTTLDKWVPYELYDHFVGQDWSDDEDSDNEGNNDEDAED